MIPVGFQGVEFPDQRQLDWTEYESLQWLRANTQYFHPDNGVYYDTGSITKVADLPANGARYSTLASNGKIYAAADIEPFVYIFDPTDNTIVSQSAGTNVRSFAVFYSPFTEKIYISGGPNGALNISTIDTTTDTFNYNVTGSIAEAAFYPVSPVLDGRYAYGTTRPDENLVRINLLEDGLTTISTGQWTGDHNQGALTWNNFQWHTLGGGASGFTIIDADDGTVDEPNYNGGISMGGGSFVNIIQHPDGFLYSISNQSPYQILKIDPTNKNIEVVNNAPNGENIRAFDLGMDGKIYMTSDGGNDLIVYDPYNNNYSSVATSFSRAQGLSPSLEGDLFIFTSAFSTNPGVYKIPLVGKEKVRALLQTGNHIAGRFRANY